VKSAKRGRRDFYLTIGILLIVCIAAMSIWVDIAFRGGYRHKYVISLEEELASQLKDGTARVDKVPVYVPIYDEREFDLFKRQIVYVDKDIVVARVYYGAEYYALVTCYRTTDDVICENLINH
jgi:hypothetical protein